MLKWSIHTLNWVFCQGGPYRHFEGGAGCFFFFDEVKMKHFVFFRGGAPGSQGPGFSPRGVAPPPTPPPQFHVWIGKNLTQKQA